MKGLFVTNADSVQAFVPDPTKSQENSAMTGTIVFGKTNSPNVNIDDWIAIKVRPTSDSTYYYNSDSTKTCTLPADVETIIWVGQDSVTSITIAFGAGTAEVQGM
jgi:hypothetical protein